MSESTDFPRAWRFHSDEGDADGPVFEGRFTGVIEMGLTQSYGEKPVARFIEEGSGEEVSIWLFAYSLQDQLKKLKPEKDELVRIEWRGKKKAKTPPYRNYHAFKATAPERPVKEVSWADLGSADDEEVEDE